MIKFFKIILSLLLSLVVIIFIGIIFAYVSVWPSVWATRWAFSLTSYERDENYLSIENNIAISEEYKYESNHGKNTFNIIYPKETNQALKTIIWVHGGAFIAGDKKDVQEYMVVLANQGYAIVNMNYQIGPKAKYPTPLIQINELYQHLENNIQKYPMIDTKNIVLAGDSAGAHIIAQYTLIQTNPEYADLVKITPMINPSYIDSVILFCGPYDFQTLSHMFKTTKTPTSILNNIVSFLAKRIGTAYLGDKNWQTSNKWGELTIKDYLTKAFPKTFLTDGKKYSFEQQGKDLVSKMREKGIEVTDIFYEAELTHEYQFNLGTIHEDGNNYAQMTFEQLKIFLKD